jgi:hypothetical protein
MFHSVLVEIGIIRLFLTCICLKYINTNNRLLVSLTLLLTEVDCILMKLYENNGYDIFSPKEFTKGYMYNLYDKIVDCMSYMLIMDIYKNDMLLLFFILYRMFGVIMFMRTKDGSWLVVFFDFVKEYLIYRHFFPVGTRYLVFFVSLKILYEYYFHKIKDRNY